MPDGPATGPVPGARVVRSRLGGWWRQLGWPQQLAATGPARVLAWQALIHTVGTGLGRGVLTIYLVSALDVGEAALALGLSLVAVVGFTATIPVGVVAQRIGPRPLLVTTNLVRATAYAALPFLPSFPWVVVALCAVAAVEAAGGSLFQLLVSAAVGEEKRVEAIAARRALSNLGFALAAPLVAVVLAIGTPIALDVAILANAVTFLVSAGLITALPAPPRAARGDTGPRLMAVRDPRFLALTGLSAVFAMSMPLIDIGLPLWIYQRTDAPTWTVGLLLLINTLLVIAFQVRLSRGTDDLPGARRAIRLSGLAFAIACLVFAGSGMVGAVEAVLLLTLAAAVAAVGEMLESAAWWTIPYRLAPEPRRAEYLATFDLGTPVVGAVGPPVMVVLTTMGGWAWVAFALVFVVAAEATIRLARGGGHGPESGSEPDSGPGGEAFPPASTATSDETVGARV